MTPLFAEFIGTTLLVLLGNGVVANVLLNKTKGQNSGLIVIAFGWAMAVFIAAFSVAAYSGAHLNPAVTLALALCNKFAWSGVFGYICAQMAGGMVGAFLVWFIYRKHFEDTECGDTKLAVFCTGPAIRSMSGNLASEVIATFVLVFAILHMVSPQVSLGAMDALPVGLVVLGIGVSLGGTTGYAMNPARDLAPRIMHSILPIAAKRDSDWSYSWIPVVGSLTGGALAASLHLVLAL